MLEARRNALSVHIYGAAREFFAAPAARDGNANADWRSNAQLLARVSAPVTLAVLGAFFFGVWRAGGGGVIDGSLDEPLRREEAARERERRERGDAVEAAGAHSARNALLATRGLAAGLSRFGESDEFVERCASIVDTVFSAASSRLCAEDAGPRACLVRAHTLRCLLGSGVLAALCGSARHHSQKHAAVAAISATVGALRGALAVAQGAAAPQAHGAAAERDTTLVAAAATAECFLLGETTLEVAASIDSALGGFARYASNFSSPGRGTPAASASSLLSLSFNGGGVRQATLLFQRLQELSEVMHLWPVSRSDYADRFHTALAVFRGDVPRESEMARALAASAARLAVFQAPAALPLPTAATSSPLGSGLAVQVPSPASTSAT